jgi:outer membrane protein OmpA-like peptidoglycan-associated protein
VIRFAALALVVSLAVWARTTAAQVPSESAPDRLDYLTFAQGAIPIHIGGAAASLGVSYEKAILATDGDPARFTLSLKPGAAETDTEFVYQLPAPTTFDRFAVPNVVEVPSPGQTFTRTVEVYGSAQSAEAGFVLLASATLASHKGRGEISELTMHAKPPVRWVKLRLIGGLQVQRPQMFFEFSEIIGNGTQQPAPLADHFRGVWKGRGVSIELRQDGPVVSGCYDLDGELKGTVSGNILRALGISRGDKVPSAFILAVNDDGTLRGVRSSNRAPFALYVGEKAPATSGPKCPDVPPPVLGCGSVVHGINFDFDSAAMRADSAPLLARLYEGLRNDTSSVIVIEGHTSSDGTDDYNQRLSERRAQAVVAELVKRGISTKRLSAAGIGEKRPIASNTDESGRSLNRRVEVHCRS